MSIDLNPETYNPEIGWEYDDLDELAADLGWSDWPAAVQSIADRFGFDSWDALVEYYAYVGVLDAFAEQLTPAEHIIWHAED